MLNTVSMGDIGEAVAQMMFIQAGYIVSKPVSNNARYDLIVEIQSKLYLVQVKTTQSIKDGKMDFATKTTNYVKGSWQSNAYTNNDIDIFFLYCIENKWCGLYFPIETNIPQHLSIRTELPKNNQSKGIRLMQDYEFNKQLELMFNHKVQGSSP